MSKSSDRAANVTQSDIGPVERLRTTAARLFYNEGVQAVGVDRLVREAKVTRATFYRHFATKDDLVVAYVRAKDSEFRSAYAAAVQALGDEPVPLLQAIMTNVVATVCGSGFRGCPFINVAVEYPDADSSARAAVTAHRDWFQQTLVDLFDRAGHRDPSAAAQQAVLLRDGAMIAGYLGDPISAAETLTTGVQELLGVLVGR